MHFCKIDLFLNFFFRVLKLLSFLIAQYFILLASTREWGFPLRFYFPDKASFQGLVRRGNARIYGFLAQDVCSLGLIQRCVHKQFLLLVDVNLDLLDRGQGAIQAFIGHRKSSQV